jgi:hypothetical protein
LTLERPELTEPIVRAALAVHRTLGPGLSSHIYRRALALEVNAQPMLVAVEERPIEITYRDRPVGKHILDLIVSVELPASADVEWADGRAVHVRPGPVQHELVVVEVKHFGALAADIKGRLDLACSQTQSYLAAARLRYGLVVNFGGGSLGVRRVVNPHIKPATTKGPIP